MSKGFSRASRSLRISQSAVSNAIKELENQHGIVLFRRSRGEFVELTPAGRCYVESCEKIFNELEELERKLTKAVTVLEGPLEIAVSDNVANYLLPPVLKELLNQHPGLIPKGFVGTGTAVQTELIENRCELGLFYSDRELSGLTAKPLGFVEFWIVVSKQVQNLRTIENWQQLPYIGFRGSDYVRPFPASRRVR